MCGICGFVDLGSALTATERQEILGAMTTSLRHRGPDSEGVWLDQESGVALGHRRLAILDLSPEGHQPMASASGRYRITFNGEIYNFRALRDELAAAGARFRGHSDTEVLLAALERWGFAGTLPRLAGMFAFALFDRDHRILHFACDRLGKKPLYIGVMGDHLLFASELKAFRAHPAFVARVDRDALALFLRYKAVPAPYAIYQAVMKLPPATSLSLALGRNRPWGVEELRGGVDVYWDLAERLATGAAGMIEDESEAVDELEALLDQVVAERMAADVPLGAFLSGGIDSSLVVAAMQAQAARPVRTFTAGFDCVGHDEADYAARIARHLGTDHTLLPVDAGAAEALIPELPDLYDEPFADSSQIPTHLIARLARQHVTVAISGDGGDESFAGYRRYFLAHRLQHLYRLPKALRRPLVAAGRAVLARLPAPALGGRWSPDILDKVAALLGCEDRYAMYYALGSHWQQPEAVVVDGREPAVAFAALARHPYHGPFLHHMMFADTVSSLPDSILTKVDRATMAVGLEVRCPLLDHRLVEYAWRLPASFKYRNGQGKWILRQALARRVPCELFERPKQGFTIPLDEWLRGPLRDWVEALLAEDRLRREGFLRPAPIRALWQEHLSGRRRWGVQLWDVLMFQAWRERWLGTPA